MVKTYFEFSATFNQAIDYKSNSFHVSSTRANRNLLELFAKHRYIFSYRNSEVVPNKFLVFPNFMAIDFRLSNGTLPSRKSLAGSKILKSSLNAGIKYIVQTERGFEFSHFFYMTMRHKCTIIFKLI